MYKYIYSNIFIYTRSRFHDYKYFLFLNKDLKIKKNFNFMDYIKLYYIKQSRLIIIC